jgi:hypothetical protein
LRSWPERPARHPAVPAELGEDRLAALVVAGDGPRPGVCHWAFSSMSSVSVFLSAVLKAS